MTRNERYAQAFARALQGAAARREETLVTANVVALEQLWQVSPGGVSSAAPVNRAVPVCASSGCDNSLKANCRRSLCGSGAVAQHDQLALLPDISCSISSWQRGRGDTAGCDELRVRTDRRASRASAPWRRRAAEMG